MFRRSLLSATALTAAVCWSAAAYADEWDGWYLGLNAGFVGTAQSKIKNTGTDTGSGGFGTGLTNGALPPVVKAKADGFLGGGQAGYNWEDSGWLLGFEGDFDGASAGKTVTVVYPGGAFSPDTSTFKRGIDWLSTLRARIGAYPDPDLLLYATGGLAIAETRIASSVSCPTWGPPCSTEPSTSAHKNSALFGATVGAGGEWMFAPSWSVKAEYLYTFLPRQHDTVVYTYGAVSSMTSTDWNSLHAVRMGINYHFNEPPSPPPPPPPLPPPPPPPPPPAVKTFIVFFDFNKANLSAEAESVVTEAVKTAKQNGFVKVMVTGHTDTVGSDRYNQALSERRAESVKDEMVRQGMDGNSIAIAGKSFHDPLVPTGPGVREPQNRRAVIDLGGGANA